MSRPIAMISSTAKDLPKHREQVRRACERMGFAPREMMEHLTALDKDAVETSLNMVDNAEVYIGVFAHRYGYVPDGFEKSVTEMEYDRAVREKIPRLIFFVDEDQPVLPKDFDTGANAAKLQALKDRIRKERVAAFFKTAADLHGHVIAALQTFKEERQDADGENAAKPAAAVLHRRSLIPNPPTADIVHPYTLSETQALVGRQKELRALTDWVSEPASGRIFCLVAIGGMGKSALTWKWFQEIAPKEMPDLEGRLWWSFYESDASFENFLNRALGYVSGLHEDDIREMAWQEKEALLLRHLDEKPYLLGLDGLERILLAYCRMDASHLADDDLDRETANRVAGAHGLPSTAGQSFIGQHKLRQTIDPRAGHFLQKLSAVRASRVLVSTRLYPSALQTRQGGPGPGCIAYFLDGLTDDDALDLWRALGVSGKRAELLPLFESFERHPLLLQALAGEVANFRGKPGDFAAWKAAHPDFVPTDLPLEQRRSHILQFALQVLDGPVREVLHTITGFRLPAGYQTLEALLIGEDKACADATALDKALSELEDRGLVGWDREANRYDAHPIVRGVVWQLAGGEARNSVHAAIDAHFEQMAVPDWEAVESLADLRPAIERYHTLVERGRLDDAWRLFDDWLNRATFYQLAAHRERIAMLEQLFPEGMGKPPALANEYHQNLTRHSLALSYEFSGRTGQAAMFYQLGDQIDVRMNDNANRQIGLLDLARAKQDAGALHDAEKALRQALLLNREVESASQEGHTLDSLGRVAAKAADKESARLALARSWTIFRGQNNQQGECVVSAHLSDFSLWQDDIARARCWADRAWRLANLRRNERDFIRAALCQGRAALGWGDQEQAEEQLHHALARTRAVNVVELELPALIAIAALELAHGKPKVARERLDEVWEPAEEGPYPLYQADAYNVLADICLAEGDESGAIEAATKAYRAAWCDGPPGATGRLGPITGGWKRPRPTSRPSARPSRTCLLSMSRSTKRCPRSRSTPKTTTGSTRASRWRRYWTSTPTVDAGTKSRLSHLATALNTDRLEKRGGKSVFAWPRQDPGVYEQIKESAERFADDVIRPVAGELDREQRFPDEIYREMADLGLFGITVPEEDGGAGLDALAYAVVMEALSRGYASVADQCGLVELISTLLSRHGTAEQKARWLKSVLSVETKVAYCITEAEAGSDVAGIKTTARKVDGGWRLSGSKLWIHNAPIADLGVVLARTDPDAGHRGMSIFLVDLHADGVTRGPKEEKMGQRASPVGGLSFDDVLLADDALLGEEGRGFYMMMSLLEKGRVGIAALAVGIAQAGLEAALDYAGQRQQFGRPLIDNQGLQWLLADMAKDIEAARALTHRAALLIDNDQPANAACSMAKCFASDIAVARAADAVQIFGGSGYIRGFEVERLYRDAKITQIYEGTNQIQRTIIARELIKHGARP